MCCRRNTNGIWPFYHVKTTNTNLIDVSDCNNTSSWHFDISLLQNGKNNLQKCVTYSLITFMRQTKKYKTVCFLILTGQLCETGGAEDWRPCSKLNLSLKKRKERKKAKNYFYWISCSLVEYIKHLSCALPRPNVILLLTFLENWKYINN